MTFSNDLQLKMAKSTMTSSGPGISTGGIRGDSGRGKQATSSRESSKSEVLGVGMGGNLVIKRKIVQHSPARTTSNTSASTSSMTNSGLSEDKVVLLREQLASLPLDYFTTYSSKLVFIYFFEVFISFLRLLSIQKSSKKC